MFGFERNGRARRFADAGTLLSRNDPDANPRSRRGPVASSFRHAIWAGLLVLAACGSSSDGGGGSTHPDPVPGPQPVPTPEPDVKAVATEVGSPLEMETTEAIGPAGGVIESADGALRVEIPAGALAAEQTVSIQAISNFAPGKVADAFRIRPEGTTFALPVRLTFHFTPEQILGSAPELLRVASQNRDGFWELHEQVQIDADAGTVSVDTNHFSDWSLVTGALLSPRSATVKVGETVPLTVVVCERVQPDDDLLAVLAAECRTSEVIRNLVRNWSVNGTPGGDGNIGTVSVLEDRSALYTAPAQPPQPNTVAVSAEYTTLQGGLVLLVSNISVQSGVCTPPGPGEPCSFELVEFNGQALPYEGLPHDPWENPEVLKSGTLALQDFDGDGAGTWSLRHVWVEKRPSGDLEKFSQLAGDFTSEASGKLHFTILGGPAFDGALEQGVVTIADYPFSTTNVTLSAQLKLRQK